MGMPSQMLRFARWHIWLGWLAGLPLVMWTLTGLVMVARPIEEVRGTHLRIDQPAAPLGSLDPALGFSALAQDTERPVEISFRMDWQNRTVMTAQYADGSIKRFDTVTGIRLPPVSSRQAKAIVARSIAGGEAVTQIRAFPAASAPFDFRRPEPVWQVELTDGTHVYVNRDTGDIAAVRTRWWRIFDFMWGLHIMDLETREDTHHPILISFATLGFIMSVLGCVLMFRRRRARRAR